MSASADVGWAAEYPLWIANYTHSNVWAPPEGANPIVPAPWDDWLFWQFSAKGSRLQIPGITAVPVDRDVFRGDLDGLRRLANIDPEAVTRPDLCNPPSEPTPIVHRSSEVVGALIEDYRKRRDQ